MEDYRVAGDSNDRFKNTNFTNDQAIAVDGILDFIAKPFDESKYIIGLDGAGGTGKTYVTDYVINKCRYSNSVIQCSTPTHKACRVMSNAMNGKISNTIQKVFGLRLNLSLKDFDPLKPQFDPLAKAKLDNVRLLIIDECSMLPSKIVSYVCNKCKALGIKIIFIGDDYQLAPPKEKRSTAFTRCFVVYHLEQLVRQSAGHPAIPLLTMLRSDIRNRKYDFLKYVAGNIGIANYNEVGEGFRILGRHAFQEAIFNSFTDVEYTKNIDMYRIISYTNNCVTAWNNNIRYNTIADANNHIITKNDLIMSYQTIVNEFMEIEINNSEEYIIYDIVNYVDPTYQFKGYLVRFQLVHGGEVTKPIFVIDHLDKPTVLRYHYAVKDLIYKGDKAVVGTRTKERQKYYDFKSKYLIATNIVGRDGKIMYPRDLDYGFSLTAHKSQGSTYGSVFVDVNDMVFDKWGRPYTNQDDMLRRLYVAASRAKKELVLCYGK